MAHIKGNILYLNMQHATCNNYYILIKLKRKYLENIDLEVLILKEKKNLNLYFIC